MTALVPTLASYRLDRELGRGAAAVVYLARDLRHSRQVAVKVLRPEIAAAIGAARFEREIRIAARLHHPNILPLFDSGQTDEGLLYYVMPYVAAGTLRSRLGQERQLPIDDAVRIATSLADALDAAHREEIVHRDIKPENILLDDGNPLIADFGVARLVGLAGQGTTSSWGAIVGTPGYMSPEQIAGDRELDGRSDVYSLGCVLFEMLGGEPPFTGPSMQAVVSRHLHEHVPSISLLRPAVPRWLAEVVEKSLAKSPVDRFASARAFKEALLEGPNRQAKRWARRRPWLRLGLSVAGVAVVGLMGRVAWLRWQDRMLDPRRHLALHFRQVSDTTKRGVDGSESATLVYDAMGRWTDIERVDRLWVEEAVEGAGGPPTTLTAAFSVARAAHAGRLIWGELTDVSDGGVGVRAVLYDVGRRAVLRDVSLTIPVVRDGGLAHRFDQIVDSLLSRGRPPPPLGTVRPFAAMEAYLAGYDSLLDWNLTAARQGFQRALELEPGYSEAGLRYAQLSQWLNLSPAEWRDVVRAAAADPQLPPAEREYATALLLFANDDYPQSCARFRALAEGDSTSFAAWFGLGDCQAADHVVVRDAASPSGYRFRSSFESAARAYQRALEVLPSAHRAPGELMIDRLEGVLFTQPGRYRGGWSVGADSISFAAYGELQRDTVAFVPIRTDRLFSLEAGSAGETAALERNRRMLDDLSRNWIRAFPQSAPAWEARARALELAGLLDGPGLETAVSSIRRARFLAADSALALRQAVIEVRLLVKAAAWRSARLLIDSLLDRPPPSPEQALVLAPLAGLVGKPTLLASLLDIGAPTETFTGPLGERFVVPPTIGRLALRLWALAAFAGSADSLAAAESKLRQLVATWPAVDQRRQLTFALMEPPARVGFPQFGARAIHDSAAGSVYYLLELQAQLARGDSGVVRSSLQRLDGYRRSIGVLPQQISMDAVLQESWLRLAVGDTTAATATLDAALATLSMQKPYLFQLTYGPLSVVRIMALRARLAEASGDPEVARTWSAAVAELWRHAEPEVANDIVDLVAIDRDHRDRGGDL